MRHPASPSYNRVRLKRGEAEALERSVLAVLPPLPEGRRRILEPLTERQLAQSLTTAAA
jgi:hypothetical protein